MATEINLTAVKRDNEHGSTVNRTLDDTQSMVIRYQNIRAVFRVHNAVAARVLSVFYCSESQKYQTSIHFRKK